MTIRWGLPRWEASLPAVFDRNTLWARVGSHCANPSHKRSGVECLAGLRREPGAAAFSYASRARMYQSASTKVCFMSAVVPIEEFR